VNRIVYTYFFYLCKYKNNYSKKKFFSTMKKSNIYLLTAIIDDIKIYKIGITKNDISVRLRALQTGNPYKISIVNSFQSKWASKVENSLHSYFKKNNVLNEWFILSDEEVGLFTELCQKTENNLQLLEDNNLFIQGNGGIKNI